MTPLFLALSVALSAAPAPMPASAHKHLNDPNQLTEDERSRSGVAQKLSDEQLKKLLAYQQGILAGLDRSQSAAKAGLTIPQLEDLQLLTRNYFLARRSAIRYQKDLEATRARTAAARKEGKQPDPADDSREQQLLKRVEEHAIFLGRYRKVIGEKAQALLDKREAEFLKVLEEQEAWRAGREQGLRDAAAKALDEARLVGFIGLMQDLMRAGPPHEQARILAAALEKAKLSRAEAEALSILAAEYFPEKQAAMADEKSLADTRQKIADARAKGGKASAFDERLERYYEERLEKFQAFRAGFAQKYSEKVPAIFDAHAAELNDIYARVNAAILESLQ